jgi:hypothetical protein
MGKYRITSPDGQTYEINAPDGATQDEIMAYAQKNFKMAALPKTEQKVEAPSKPFGEALTEGIKDIPRQLGLTARYGLEGVGGTANFIASPARAAMNAVGMNIPEMNPKGWADSMGLPEPKNATERIVGDASRLVAGSAVPIGAASGLAKNSTGLTKAVATQMAANPASQLVSAAGAGGAGGYTRETGGDASAQFLASLAGGMLAPAAMRSGESLLNRAMNLRPQAIQHQNIDIKLQQVFNDSGMKFGDLPSNVRNSIRNDVAEAMKTNGDLSSDAIRRLADYRLVGATPSRAGITLDPAIVTQQKNLAKLGANSNDKAAQQLAMLENQNNAKLIDNLNNLGAVKGLENEAAGNMLATNLANVAEANKAKIGQLYSAARDSSGRSAPLDPSHFTQKLGDTLNQANLEAFLPAEIRSMVNNFATGKTPLNINTAEQFKTIVGNSQRSAENGNIRTALGLVRQTLDETPLLGQVPRAGGNQVALQGQVQPQLGQEAIDAFNKARAANRSFMGQVEQTPALKAAMDGVSDKGFFEKFILRGDSKQLQSTLKVLGDNQNAVQSIRDNVIAHLKEKAVSGAADEVGKFSQSRYNAALKMLGSNKLEMLFSPEEIAQLKAVGRVASYEQFQPAGAAVNNSNTAAGIGGLMERIGSSPLLSKIPLGKMLAEPLQNISIGINSGKALNVPSVLTQPQAVQNTARYGLPPAAMLGLLSQYQQ